MLKFENYRQDLRNPYYAKHVQQRFYEAISKIDIPVNGDRFAMITVKPKGNAGWYENNNAMNAFEFKLNRKLWKRKSRHEKMPNVGSIEPDNSFLKYHFHYLVKLKEIKVLFSDDEIKKMIAKIIRELTEVNSQDPNAIDILLFKYDETKANTRSDSLGTCIHYLVKSSHEHHNPLERKIYSKRQQEQTR